MKEQNNYEQIKKNFMQAQNYLIQMKDAGEGERITLNELVWLELFKNEAYYNHAFSNFLFKNHVSNAQQRKEDHFYHCFLGVIEEIMVKFTPDKGKLENFFNTIWSYRTKTLLDQFIKEDKAVYIEKENEENTGGKIKAPQGPTVFPDPNEIALAQIIVELMNSIVQMQEHNSKENLQKMYFKMFFTGYMTEYCKSFVISREVGKKEKSIWMGMHKEFLDFYMKCLCRTFRQIQETPLKTERELKGKDSDKEIKLPLEKMIYALYLGVTSANVTAKLKEFAEFGKEIGIRDSLTE